MSLFFQYSVLKYRPSYLLDERINIGLLFRFVKEEGADELTFVFPLRLSRISQAFPNLGPKNIQDIKRYLKAFEKAALRINRVNDSLYDIIPTEFIIDDANSLFFSETKEGFYQSVEKTITYYKEQYFKFYDLQQTKSRQDEVVKKVFEKSLKNLTSPEDIRLKYFEHDVSIKNKITSSRFEYRWQNGTANLVKTLGFNLSDKQDIQDKAFKWTSAINNIYKIKDYRNYHFDILVGRPKHTSLYTAYDAALEILEDINAPKSIIEEKGIEEYAAKALSTVKPFHEEA